MSANLNYKITGVKGGKPVYHENTGRIVVFESNDDYFVFDAFQGQGSKNNFNDNPYKRRENVDIEIVYGGELLFNGTLEQLKNKLIK